jgi:hypothetical protein
LGDVEQSEVVQEGKLLSLDAVAGYFLDFDLLLARIRVPIPYLRDRAPTALANVVPHVV